VCLNTLSAGTPTRELSEEVTLIPPSVTIFTFKQSQDTSVKTGDEEGK